jgi:hypothetical protein
MNIDEFLRKYGTRAVSLIIRELAARKKDNTVAFEAADDLQNLLENLSDNDEFMHISIREAVNRFGGNGKGDNE